MWACLWLPPARAATPARGNPAARRVHGEFGGEYYDVLSRLDDGRLVFAVAAVHNLGWGDGSAGVLGLIVSPDGEVNRFSRSENVGHWKLEADGRRMDLHSIVLDQSRPGARFQVEKDELHLRLDVAPGGRPGAADAIPGTSCPLDLLDLDGETHGSLWRTGMAAPVPLRGRSNITHRWMEHLEVDCLVQRVELFVLEPEWGVYFDEVRTPDGRVGRWLAVSRDGTLLHEGPPSSADLEWGRDAKGLPVLRALRFAAGGISARVKVGELRARFDPFAGIPGLLRTLLEKKMQPSVLLRAATAEIADASGGTARLHREPALAKVSWLRSPSALPPGAGGRGG